MRPLTPIVSLLALAPLLPCMAADPPDTLWTGTLDIYERDCIESVAATTDGGFALAGCGMENSGAYLEIPLLLKLDPDGKQCWMQTYPDSSVEYSSAWAMEQTPDGGFLLGCTGCYFEDRADIRAIRTDSSGNLLWEVRIGDGQEDWCYDMTSTSDGGFAFCGGHGIWPGAMDMELVKTDSLCNVEWIRYYGSVDEDIAFSIRQTSDGGLLLTGDTDQGSQNYWYVVKTDSEGEMEWERRWLDSSTWGRLVGGVETPDGSFTVIGRSYSNAHLFRLDSSGNIEWERILHNRGLGRFMQTDDGGYVIAGLDRTTSDTWLARTDDQGYLIWETTIQEYSCSNHADALCQTLDEGYFVGGGTNPGAGLTDIYFLLFESCQGGIETGPQSPGPRLLSASPNPFNASITVTCTLPFASPIELTIYDAAGRIVASRDYGMLPAGQNSLEWTPSKEVPAGYYSIIIDACGSRLSRGCVRI